MRCLVVILVLSPATPTERHAMIEPAIYDQIINDVLDTIAEMRISGDYDENTLETLEYKLSAPTEDNGL